MNQLTSVVIFSSLRAWVIVDLATYQLHGYPYVMSVTSRDFSIRFQRRNE